MTQATSCATSPSTDHSTPIRMRYDAIAKRIEEGDKAAAMNLIQGYMNHDVARGTKTGELDAWSNHKRENNAMFDELIHTLQKNGYLA